MKPSYRLLAAFAGGLALAAGLVGCTGSDTDIEVIVYSARNEQLIKPIFDLYTRQTGVPIRFVTDKAEPLMQRLAAEGANTPADILLTVDAGNLWHAAELGLLQPVQSAVIDNNVPAHLRDPEGLWAGYSVRARTIVYSTERVAVDELGSYAELGSETWRGRLCLRTAKKVYNQSLVAMLIAENGEAEAEAIVRHWVANLATEVFANDTQVMEAIAAGQCDVGIVNSYYFGRLLRDRPDLPLALYWPDGAAGGVHVNVAGAGLVRHARHSAAAVAFLEWLSSAEAQGLFASVNLEYPANPAVAPDPIVAEWGSFEASRMNLAQAGQLQAAAVRLMDRAGYN